MKEIRDITIACRRPPEIAMGPNGLTLLDKPKNPGFMAFVNHEKGIWEHGQTREEAEAKMRQTAEAAGWEIGDIHDT